ncbi:CDP-diacylglycerol--inositol 3-phosphatidyltransferase, partial [Tremellales sp. Uapishka_1]
MAPTTRSKQSSPDRPGQDGQNGLKPRRASRSRTRDEIFDAKYSLDLAVDENVFLFVPNLIGYARVILAAASLVYMPYHPKLCTLLYAVSSFLDVADGQAARALNQTSKFGAVLDMVTDRCATACLLCFLASTYPRYALIFQFLITLDFSSHYIHMYSSLLTGSSSHKKVTLEVSRILWYYYNDSRTLFLFCFFNECFFVCLYLNAFWTTPLFSASSPIVSILSSRIGEISPKLAAHFVWALRSLTWPALVGGVTFPVMAGKQIINVVQFWKASKILVGVDLAERQAAREAAALGKPKAI